MTFADWAARVAADFRNAEHADVYTGRQPRGEALVLYTVRALAEGGCPATASIIEHINRERAHRIPS